MSLFRDEEQKRRENNTCQEQYNKKRERESVFCYCCCCWCVSFLFFFSGAWLDYFYFVFIENWYLCFSWIFLGRSIFHFFLVFALIHSSWVWLWWWFIFSFFFIIHNFITSRSINLFFIFFNWFEQLSKISFSKPTTSYHKKKMRIGWLSCDLSWKTIFEKDCEVWNDH